MLLSLATIIVPPAAAVTANTPKLRSLLFETVIGIIAVPPLVAVAELLACAIAFVLQIADKAITDKANVIFFILDNFGVKIKINILSQLLISNKGLFFVLQIHKCCTNVEYYM